MFLGSDHRPRPASWLCALTSITILGSAGCAARRGTPTPLAREPIVHASYDVDVASLAKAQPLAIDPDDVSPGLEWRNAGYVAGVIDAGVVEVRVGGRVLFAGTSLVSEWGWLQRTFCADPDEPESISWTEFDPRSVTRDAIGVETYEGTLDATSCMTTPRRAWRSEARAIVPGAVWAYASPPHPVELFGVELPPFDDADTRTIELLAPKALWFATSAATEEEAMHLGAPFTHLTVVLRRGDSAVVTLDLAIDEVAEFEHVSENQAARDLLGDMPIDARSAESGDSGVALPLRSVSVRLDFVWVDGDTEPSGMASVSPLHGRPVDLARASGINKTITPSALDEAREFIQRAIQRAMAAARRSPRASTSSDAETDSATIE